jgi:hypothetical protein
VPSYPWSILDFCRDLSTKSYNRQQLSPGCSSSMEHSLLKGIDNSPSSIARPGASPPSDVLPPPGRQGRLPGFQPHHYYSWRLQTSAPSGLAPHPGSPANRRLLPGLTLAVHQRALLRRSQGLLHWLPPPARGLLWRLLGSPAPSLQRAPPRGW